MFPQCLSGWRCIGNRQYIARTSLHDLLANILEQSINVHLLQNIQEHWSIKLNEDINVSMLKHSPNKFSCCIGYIFKTKLIHNRVMTSTILLKMNLADSSTRLLCNREVMFMLFLIEKMLPDSDSNTKNLLQIPLTNLKRFGDRAFCAYAPRLWNELPDNIKAADNVQNFKKLLKTLLFRKEFN